jgi:ATP-binding cassette subfamily B protein
VLLFIAVGKGLNFAIPFVLKEMVDFLAIPESFEQKVFVGILGLIIIYALLNISSTLLHEAKEYISTKISFKIVSHIGQDVFNFLHSLDVSFALSKKVGVISRDIDRGLKAIQSLTGLAIYSIIPTFIELVLVSVYFCYAYNSTLSLTMFVTLVIYVLYSFVATNMWSTSRREINESDSDLNQKLLESLSNFEIIKYFSRERYEFKLYKKSLERFSDASTRAQATHSKILVGQHLITSIGIAAIFWQTAIGVSNKTMTVGDLVLINSLMFQIFTPLAFVGLIYKDLLQGWIDIQQLNKVFGGNISEGNPEVPIELIDLKGAAGYEVEFKNVSFNYDGRKHLFLTDLSFKLLPGTLTAIVGDSGSGKSTLTKLLFRLFPVGGGAILINNRNINTFRADDLRRLISVVPQDTNLFHGSIFYNIKYGNLAASEEDVFNAASKAQLDQFIAALPDGYQTIVGERGFKISGGERQRISIARALLKDAPIFIFDEATSALDSGTEKKLHLDVAELIKNKTALVIAHRLSTIQSADQILYMRNGKIIEVGNHSELLNLKGAYYSAWIQQQASEVGLS